MIKQIKLLLHDLFQCPACEGAGGSVEPILDDGSGPWEPCGFCREHGYLYNPLVRHWARRAVEEDKKLRRRFLKGETK
jgi:hypothetical protein